MAPKPPCSMRAKRAGYAGVPWTRQRASYAVGLAMLSSRHAAASVSSLMAWVYDGLDAGDGEADRACVLINGKSARVCAAYAMEAASHWFDAVRPVPRDEPDSSTKASWSTKRIGRAPKATKTRQATLDASPRSLGWSLPRDMRNGLEGLISARPRRHLQRCQRSLPPHNDLLPSSALRHPSGKCASASPYAVASMAGLRKDSDLARRYFRV